jgi:hypothetical protein
VLSTEERVFLDGWSPNDFADQLQQLQHDLVAFLLSTSPTGQGQHLEYSALQEQCSLESFCSQWIQTGDHFLPMPTSNRKGDRIVRARQRECHLNDLASSTSSPDQEFSKEVVGHFKAPSPCLHSLHSSTPPSTRFLRPPPPFHPLPEGLIRRPVPLRSAPPLNSSQRGFGSILSLSRPAESPRDGFCAGEEGLFAGNLNLLFAALGECRRAESRIAAGLVNPWPALDNLGDSTLCPRSRRRSLFEFKSESRLQVVQRLTASSVVLRLHSCGRKLTDEIEIVC